MCGNVTLKFITNWFPCFYAHHWVFIQWFSYLLHHHCNTTLCIFLLNQSVLASCKILQMCLLFKFPKLTSDSWLMFKIFCAFCCLRAWHTDQTVYKGIQCLGFASISRDSPETDVPLRPCSFIWFSLVSGLNTR